MPLLGQVSPTPPPAGCVPPTAKCATAGTTNQTYDRIRYFEYFLAAPKDRLECNMHVENRRIVFDAPVTNPGMTCPDAFSWKLYAEAIGQEFWKNWASDDQTWPASPYAPCAGQPSDACCDLTSLTQNPAHCPLFPGALTAAGPRFRLGVPPSKPHIPGMVPASELPALLKRAGETDPDRVIRQSMTEIVFRNRPMLAFVRRNRLYSTDGLADVFARNNANLGTRDANSGAPYYLVNQPGALSTVDFPSDAVMIKSDWVIAKYAKSFYGITEDPDHPFIKMIIDTASDPNNPNKTERAECWLLSIHVSSKDIPNWVWTTFEHVNNRGRCDYIGCNDSFGFSSSDQTCPGQARNYTAAHTSCDNLASPAWVFDLGKSYASGPISPSLDAVFNALGIGSGPAPLPGAQAPTPRDPAWRSYRLKGSQTEFTDSTGRRTLLANSITEAGFILTSSCMTCHARSGVNASGNAPLGVFVNEVNEQGYLQSVNGIPIPDWFHGSSQPPRLQTLQCDFVWGILAASPEVKPGTLQAPPQRKTPRDAMRRE
ncbi:MAG TPA: hypothetical protein VLV78_11270 [Thermoanaerobaculia bacterium]|nr:hypothetical protein [Thermoanaerobaculia bacterium]